MQVIYVDSTDAVAAVLENGFRPAVTARFKRAGGVPFARSAGRRLGVDDAAILVDVPGSVLARFERNGAPGYLIPAAVADRYPVVAYRGIEIVSQPPAPRRARGARPAAVAAVVLVTAAAANGVLADVGQNSVGHGEGVTGAERLSREPSIRKSHVRLAANKERLERPRAEAKRKRAGRAEKSAVSRVIAAANQIATAPYVLGGGHGAGADSGYDCSGSVSYALRGGGLLAGALDSSGFTGYGLPGPGKHITIYANAGHVYMTVDGRRFDTSSRRRTGSRWGGGGDGPAGYVVRHPPGL